MSSNYRALTRTYRPLTFDDIVSQTHVSSTLKNAIKQNRLAHAYMFCGPRGVGKTTMARVLARTVNSIDDDVDGESLNQTLNVIEIDAASNNGVDDIRDLRERVRIPPQNGRYKVYIIDEVHMLSTAAFNALLKTLEEPPDHVIFIFATTEPQKVLPTILSRVQRFDFKRISVDEIVERLRTVTDDEDISVDDESLHVIAKKADGALRDALGLLDQAIAFCGTDIAHEELLQALNVVSTDRMFEFMEPIKTKNAARGLQLIDELLLEGYDIQDFLVGFTEHVRNLYVARQGENRGLIEASAATKKRYAETAADFSEDDLMRMLHLLSEAQFKVKEAQQPKIQFEISLLKLVHMERSQRLDELLAQLQDVKKKLNERPGSTSSKVDADELPDAAEADTGEDKKEPTEPSAALEHGTNEGDENEHSPSPVEPTAQRSSYTSADDSVSESLKSTATDDPYPTSPAATVQDDESAAAQEPNTPQNEAAKPPAVNTAKNADERHHPEKNGDATNSDAEKKNTPAEKEAVKEDIFGMPSLGSPSVAAGRTHAGEESDAAGGESEAAEMPTAVATDINLAAVKDVWSEYVADLKGSMPQMIYFQMQRVEPVQLKNRTLMLQCNDDFALKMVEEHKRTLAKMLEEKIGGFLQFNCSVREREVDPETSMSPYERFKKLQERDPQIKTLVELFGAELDYNLTK